MVYNPSDVRYMLVVVFFLVHNPLQLSGRVRLGPVREGIRDRGHESDPGAY